MSLSTVYARDLMDKLFTKDALTLLEVIFSETDQEKVLEILLEKSG